MLRCRNKLNEGQCGNQINIIYINRRKKKKQKRDLKNLRENRQERRDKEEEEKRGGNKGKRKGVEENKFKGKIQVVKCINVC